MVRIARGWWSALEPALLAFTVVVCGSVSLPADAHAAALDGSHLRGTASSDYLTAAAPDGDSLDSGGKAADAFQSARSTLPSDDDLSRALAELEFGARPGTRSACFTPRGPPDRPLPSYTPADFDRNQHFDVRVDDDDHDDDDNDDGDRDDGGAAEVGGFSLDVSRGPCSVLIVQEFDDICSFASGECSLRAPPR